jgi:type III secretion system-like peptide-binding chaperone
VPDERVIQQVYGILSMNKVEFRTDDAGKSFLVPYGSAGVFVDFRDWSDGQTLLNVHAFVLDQVDVAAERRLKILEELNEVNKANYLGKVYLDVDAKTIVLEHDLLGNDLDADELMGALRTVASMADDLDDRLREAIGTGRSAKAAWDEANAQAQTPEGTGPVVSA